LFAELQGNTGKGRGADALERDFTIVAVENEKSDPRKSLLFRMGVFSVPPPKMQDYDDICVPGKPLLGLFEDTPPLQV